MFLMCVIEALRSCLVRFVLKWIGLATFSSSSGLAMRMNVTSVVFVSSYMVRLAYIFVVFRHHGLSFDEQEGRGAIAVSPVR
jgi:hypothetical protein